MVVFCRHGMRGACGARGRRAARAALTALAASLLLCVGAQASGLDSKVKKARDKVFPALVNVRPILELYRGGEKYVTGRSIGSGVIFTAEGHVITNFHVAGHAEKVILTMGTKERIHGKVLGGDPWTDLAVVQIDMAEWARYHPDRKLPFAKIGNSDKLEIGESVLAMGSPRGLSRSLTMGIISNDERYLGEGMSLPTGERTGNFNVWLQTDAAINPGNSGGPMVNMKGEIVGINSRGVGGSNNLGFAVPSNLVRRVVEEILAKGKVTRSNIGVRLQELKELEEMFGVDTRQGVLVSAVEPSSPAEEAGLEGGDVIMAFDGEAVSARFEEELPGIYNTIARWPVGSKHTLRVQRQGRDLEVNVVTEELTQVRGKETEVSDWGLTVRDITEAQKRELDVEHGAYVTGTKGGGLAARGKLESGDVIQEVDGTPTPTVVAFKKAVAAVMAKKDEKKVIGVKIIRGKGKYIRAVRLAE